MPTRRIHRPLLWLGLLCCAGASQAQTLTDVVRHALDTHPALLAAQARTSAAQADIARARSAHYPQISLNAGLNSYASGSTPAATGRSTVSPSARLNLWSGGRVEADAEHAQALSQASQAQQRQSTDEVALQACEAYLGWIKHAQLLALAQRNLQAHQDTLEDIQKIALVDTGRRIDLAQAQVRVDNAGLTVQSRQADLGLALQRLQRFWPGTSHPPQTPAAPSDLTHTPLAQMPASLEQAMAHVDDSLPALAQLQAQVTAAQAALRQARGLYWPTVDLLSSRQFNTNTLRFDTLTQVQLSMALYNGHATSAQMDTAAAQLQAAQATLEDARWQHKDKVAQAWQEWDSARSRATLGATQAQTSDSVVEGYRQQFRLGRRSLLDLLNIQTDSFNYRHAALSALHDERIARARLLASTGELAQRFTAATTSTR